MRAYLFAGFTFIICAGCAGLSCIMCVCVCVFMWVLKVKSYASFIKVQIFFAINFITVNLLEFINWIELKNNK